MTRNPRTAAHEAAHVVVGCALGLRLDYARVLSVGGETQFLPPGSRLAFGLMYAAGCAWEAMRPGGLAAYARVDRRLAREQLRGYGVRADVRSAVTAARAILESRRELHHAVTDLLIVRDITGRDVRRLAAQLAGRCAG